MLKSFMYYNNIFYDYQWGLHQNEKRFLGFESLQNY